MEKRSVAGLVALVSVLLGAAVAAHHFGWLRVDRIQALGARLREGHGVFGAGAVFALIYAGVAVLGLPTTPLNLVGGALFGAVAGTVINVTGGTAGSIAGYWLARAVGRESIRRLFCRHKALARFADAPSFMTLLRLQIIPMVPLSVLIYGPALVKMPFPTYLAAMAIGLIPATAVYTYFGDSILGGVAGARHRALLHVVIACVLLLAVSFIPKLFGRKGAEIGGG